MPRYHRQELIIGKEAQNILNASNITIVGLGALGTVVANLLTRSGVNLHLIDRDIIEESNLQRQILYNESHINQLKAITAKKILEKINSTIKIAANNIHLNQSNIDSIKNTNLIIDCTDNLKTRFLINDFCKKNNIPWIYGAAIKTEGYLLPITNSSPCLSCFLKETSLETCETTGVLNSITSIIGSLQAELAIKILTNQEYEKNMIYFNTKNNNLKKIILKRDPNCPTCKNNYTYLNKISSTKTTKFCGKNLYQIEGTPTQPQKFQNITVFKDGRALIKANSIQEAEAIYSKTIGN